MDDDKIIQLYFARSESAIAETSGKFGAYLNQVAWNILRCREDTEEVVSDTYMAAWNAIPPAVPRVLKHFLSRITRNLALDRLDYLTAKCRSTHLDVLLSELEDCLPDLRGSAEEMLQAKQLGICLNRFLATLSREDCRIFLNRYYYGLTIPEVSEKYGIPPRTIKYRLTCLRRQLRTYLEKEGIPV